MPGNCATIARRIRLNGWEDVLSLRPAAVSNRVRLAETCRPARTNTPLFRGFSKVSCPKPETISVHRTDGVIPAKCMKERAR